MPISNWVLLLVLLAFAVFLCFVMFVMSNLTSAQRRANLLASSPTADTVVAFIVICFLLIIVGYRFPVATRGLSWLVSAMLIVVLGAIARLVARQILRRKLTRSRVDAAGRRIS